MVGRVDVAGPGEGFGHMNGYQARFVLQEVELFELKDLAPDYDPAEFSKKRVRFPTAYISGRVSRDDGGEVESIWVVAISPTEPPPYREDFSELTDEKGRYRIEVPPGEYIVAVGLEEPPSVKLPYAATFFVGTHEHSKARVLKLADRDRARVDIALTGPLQKRVIPVLVRWPDGRVVPDANVWLKEVDNPYSVVGGAVSHTRSDGRFDLVGIEGRVYAVSAGIHLKPRYTPYCAEKVIVQSDHPVDMIEMILAKTGESCRE